jgi:hypothetical protein
MHLPYEPVLPIDSLLLVTGVNGFLGSHVVNQFLRYGYRVRGTVRNLRKDICIQELFDEEYGPGRFELVQVEQLSAPGALDAHLVGEQIGCQWHEANHSERLQLTFEKIKA